jgi:hypothetical protein
MNAPRVGRPTSLAPLAGWGITRKPFPRSSRRSPLIGQALTPVGHELAAGAAPAEPGTGRKAGLLSKVGGELGDDGCRLP